MNKQIVHLFLTIILCLLSVGINAKTQETATCYPEAESSVADFWLSNFYYAQCTDYASKGSKLFGEGPYIDFGGGSSVEFTNIRVSDAGKYTVRLNYGIGYAGEQGAQLKVYVNNTQVGVSTVYALSQNPPAKIDISVDLLANTSNTIRFEQSVDWPLVLGIELIKQQEEDKTKVASVESGNLNIDVYRGADNKYFLSFLYNGLKYNTLEADYPVYLAIRTQKLVSRYTSFTQKGDSLFCTANITTPRGSQIDILDTYVAQGSGNIDLVRKINIVKAVSGDTYFNTMYGFQTSSGVLTDNEYFVPGVWYKGNFDPECNLPTTVPQAGDKYLLYREDRICLPMIMSRNKSTGVAITILHKDSDPQTVVADSNNDYINAGYQYGALGVRQENNTIYQTFVYPGNEETTASGRGFRYHPFEVGVDHEYTLRLSFASSTNYASAVQNSWQDAFALYDPTIYPVNLTETYDGVIETLLKYYVPSIAQGGTRDAPGFPFQVSLSDFKPMGIDYQMGFVGMQLPSGYYLFREGIEKADNSTQVKGESILDFWANSCLSSLGYPRSWYDPGLNGNKGSFRSDSNLRTCTGGMEGLLTAWCFAKKNNIEKAKWLQTCRAFGDWLVNNQNADGSYYFSYNHQAVLGEKHPVSNYNKQLTICAIRYLVELYIATDEVSYRDAALKAGAYCYTNIHEKYHYTACVVDNPQTIDSESGQIALVGFLSLYDLTKDSKWLDAAEQAANYSESWMYSFEIPVENDRTGSTAFPKDRSIIGQHLIAVGHAASDLGAAWLSFPLYRLYLETGNEHYLHTARMAAHNSKQSMNWDQSLFPGEAKGLQLEAFGVTIPRRVNGVMTTLNWNYAAHLDPMFRFKDAFGVPDLEEVEKMSIVDRKRMIERYSNVQSSNYGQDELATITENTSIEATIYPNPVKKNEELYISIPGNRELINVEMYNIVGNLVLRDKIDSSETNSVYTMSVPEGQYLLLLKGASTQIVKKLLVK